MTLHNPSDGAASPIQKRHWLFCLLLPVLVAIQLAPIWAFKYIPTCDGPAHVENCFIIRNYSKAADSGFRDFFVLRNAPDPNLGGHAAMTGLMYFVSPLLAEKILLSVYVVLLPFAFAYALRQVWRKSAALALLILPFTFTYTFQMGFYNFSLGMPFFFLVAGYWLKHRENFRAVNAVVLGLLLLALYCCHVVPMTLAIVFMAVMGGWLTLVHVMRGRREMGHFDWETAWGGIVSRVIIPFIAAAPTLAMFGWFMINAKRKHLLPPKSFDASRREQIMRLIRFDYFPSYHDWEGWIFQALGVLIVVGGIVGLWEMIRRRPTHVAGFPVEVSDANRAELRSGGEAVAKVNAAPATDAGVLSGLILVVLAFAAMFITQGTQFYLGFRLNLFIVLAAIFWLGAACTDGRMVAVLQIGFTAAALVLTFNCFDAYRRLNPQVEEFVSCAPQIERNSTLLALSYARKGWTPDGGTISSSVVPFLYTAGHLVAMRDVVDLTNYEANTGYFPVGFRPEVNPYDYKGPALATSKFGLDINPPEVDIAGYEMRSKKTVDYVLLWGTDQQLATPDSRGQVIATQLEGKYELVYTSKPNGLTRLWKRKG